MIFGQLSIVLFLCCLPEITHSQSLNAFDYTIPVFINCADDYKRESFNKCNQCLPTYYQISESTCIPKDPFCELFRTSDDECIQCKPGFRLNEGYFCTPDLTNCQQFQQDNPQKCTICRAGFILANGGCANNANNSICLRVNSTVKSKCDFCRREGYYLEDGVCYAKTLKGCGRLQFQTGKCLQCYSGNSQTLVGGQCYNRMQQPNWYNYQNSFPWKNRRPVIFNDSKSSIISQYIEQAPTIDMSKLVFVDDPKTST